MGGSIKFIQLKSGLSLRKDCIESVERIDGSRSKIMTDYNTYEINMPYETVLQLLEMDISPTERVGQDTNDIVRSIINQRSTQQYWAG